MALRLSDHVLCGEIVNTGHYSVHGWLGLRGCRRPLLLQLTGDCGVDLKGRHIRFEIQGLEDEEEEPDTDGDPAGPFFGRTPDSGPDTIDTLGLAWQQIGPTGTMTADRKVKVSDCPPEELYLRTKLGEPPPFEWKRLLYLEWFSQNGRVVLELADPIIESVEEDDSEGDLAANGEGNAAESSQVELLGDLSPDGDAPSGGLEIEAIHLDEDGNAYLEDLTPEISEDSEEEENPFGVVSDELQRQFDADAHQTDWEIQSDEDKPRSLRELELMDDLIENSPGEPIVSIFDSPVKLPSPDKLDDAEAEEALKTLLAQLALYGIALDVCEHFTPRDCYRVLIENICQEEHVYPELRDTQWVQHFATGDYCEACLAEFDEEVGESPETE